MRDSIVLSVIVIVIILAIAKVGYCSIYIFTPAKDTPAICFSK